MTKAEFEVKIKALIEEYAPEGTAFKWSRSLHNVGSCSYKSHNNEYWNFIIYISWPIASCNTWEVIKKTVIHEIAHANTPNHGHDAIWKRECLRLGGDGKRLSKPTTLGGDVVVPYKWEGICPTCNCKFYRNRKENGYHCRRIEPVIWTSYKIPA